jgi:hypothetical protein
MGFPGVTWLPEAVSLPPETALKSPGARELPGPRYTFPELIESQQVRDLSCEGGNGESTSYERIPCC